MKTNLPHFEYESQYSKKGFKYIAGIDEVGRGPWAGPLVAAAVVLPPRQFSINNSETLVSRKMYRLPSKNVNDERFSKFGEIDDSKKLSEKKRNELDIFIRENALDYGIGEVSSAEIDEIGLQPATFLAFSRAIEKLRRADFLLIDAIKWKNCKLPFEAIIKGDSISLSIAAASIIAKVYRDHKMREYHSNFPVYGFDKHKGYGTKIHIDALDKFGICELHRKSFKPIKALLIT